MTCLLPAQLTCDRRKEGLTARTHISCSARDYLDLALRVLDIYARGVLSDALTRRVEGEQNSCEGAQCRVE